MTVLLILLGIVLGLAIPGQFLAWATAPKIIQHHKYEIIPRGELDDRDTENVKNWLWAFKLVWPVASILFFFFYIMGPSNDRLIESRDPQAREKRRQRELKEREEAQTAREKMWLADVQKKELEVFGEIRTTEA